MQIPPEMGCDVFARTGSRYQWTCQFFARPRSGRATNRRFFLTARCRRSDEKNAEVCLPWSAVKSGMPLVWSVYLGIVSEEPALPQASGGHMRLIIGWNPQTSEVLYSDTWGRGHELKRMKLDDAWTITLGLYAIQPRYGGR